MGLRSKMSVNSWTYELINGHPDSPPGSAEVAESFKQHLVPTSVQEKSCSDILFPANFYTWEDWNRSFAKNDSMRRDKWRKRSFKTIREPVFCAAKNLETAILHGARQAFILWEHYWLRNFGWSITAVLYNFSLRGIKKETAKPDHFFLATPRLQICLKQIPVFF